LASSTVIVPPGVGAAVRRVYWDARSRGRSPASARLTNCGPGSTRLCVRAAPSGCSCHSVVDGVARGLGPGGDADLVEDVRQVPGDCAVADVEPLAALPVWGGRGPQGQRL